MRTFAAVVERLTAGRPLVLLQRMLAPGQSCYLVGGALRNAFLGRICQDFDFTAPYDPTDFARRIARRLGGHWFYLDEQRRQSRVVLDRRGDKVSFDFAPFRAAALAEDLRLRDFTVNAMAVALHGGRSGPALIDPLGGEADLAHRRLRICSAGVLQRDPVRILKGIRHCVTLGLRPDAVTLKAMSAAAGRLETAAPERISRELAVLFEFADNARGLELLHRTAVDRRLFGVSCDHAAWAAAVERVQTQARALAQWRAWPGGEWLEAVFAERFDEAFSRRAALFLAAFLVAIGFGRKGEVLDRLRLSRRTREAVKGYAGMTLRRLQELRHLSCSWRGRMLWVQALGRDPAGCLLALPCGAASQDPATVQAILALLREFRDLDGGRLPDLVSGYWVCRRLGVAPGPGVGKVLTALRRAEMAGLIFDEAAARDFVVKEGKKVFDKVRERPL